MKGLKIIQATRNHFDLILDMFINGFALHEPMTKAAKATPEDMREVYTETVDHILDQPYSFVAFVGKKAVGFSLNYIEYINRRSRINPDNNFDGEMAKKIANLKQSGSRNFKRINAVVAEVEKNYVFYMPDGYTFFKTEVIYVLPDFTGKGIGKKLFEKTVDKGKTTKADYMVGTLSDLPSCKIWLKKGGFKIVREIKYEAFYDNGKKIFTKLHDGNKSIKLCIKKI